MARERLRPAIDRHFAQRSPKLLKVTLEDVTRAAVEAFFSPRWNPKQHPLASLS